MMLFSEIGSFFIGWTICSFIKVDVILLGKELPGCKGLALPYISWHEDSSTSVMEWHKTFWLLLSWLVSIVHSHCLPGVILTTVEKFDMKVYAACFYLLLYYLAPTMITPYSFQVVQYSAWDRQDLASRRSFEKKLESDFDKSLEMAAWAVSVTSGRTGIDRDDKTFIDSSKWGWTIWTCAGWEQGIWSMKEE